MPADPILTVRNGEAFAVTAPGPLPIERFRREVIESVARGGRVAAFFARRETDARRSLTAVIAADAESSLRVLSTVVEREYPSLTPDCPQVHWFEREVFEQQGLIPAGHPWLKPIRFTAGASTDQVAFRSAKERPFAERKATKCGVTDFFRDGRRRGA